MPDNEFVRCVVNKIKETIVNCENIFKFDGIIFKIATLFKYKDSV